VTRVVVITGVAGGIGRACAVAFAADGWDVVGIGRGERPDGLVGSYERIDLAVRSATGRLRDLFARLGRVDALVNNAALEVAKPLVDTSDEEWAVVQATNVTAPFVAIREAEPYLRASKGSVINISSVHAVATSAGVAAYAASKGALVALTRAAALELGPAGIRVNAVLPGAIDTPMLRHAAAERLGPNTGSADPLADLAARTPLGRIGRPEEIASVVLFLADAERSGFVTGQGWVVDGGATARLGTE
jgi:glucose 1-dehydrogenase